MLIALAILVLGAFFVGLAFNGSQPAQAETGKKALILESSVSGGALSREAVRATDLGFTVTLVDDATYGAMTAAQFSDYQLVIIGDPTCSNLRPVVSQNAKALADAVMNRGSSPNTKVGNRVLVGTDPVFHYSQGGNKVVDTAIAFAGAQEGATGLHLSFTCGDPDYDANGVRDGLQKLLPLLTIDPTPGWTENPSPPCGGSASLISNAAQFSSLKSSDIQGWGCSVHETFPTFPSDWNPLAVATDTSTKPTCGTDVDSKKPACGEAHILISGSGIVSTAPNLSVTPTTATNPVGTTHTVTAKVTNNNGTARSGVKVNFVVTGANAGAAGTCSPAGCVSGADGKVSFTYTGTNLGNDTINASATIDGSTQTATAAKTWVKSGPADLAVVQSVSRNGNSLIYTITVKNNGPAAASGVSLTSTLPAGVPARGIKTSQGSCTGLGTNQVRCSLGDVGVGGTVTIQITVRPRSSGTLTNTASVTGDQPDPNTSNNRATDTRRFAIRRAARRDRRKPQVRIAGVAGVNSCVRSNFSARFRIREPRLRRVAVFLDGRRIMRTRRKVFRVRVKAASMRSGRHRLRAVAVDRAGNRRVVRRVFRRCARPAAVPHFTG